VDLHAGLETTGCEKQDIFPFYFLFLRILMDETFIFVSSRFRKVEIDFDVGFIMRPTNFLLIDTSFLIIVYTNIKKIMIFLFCISLKRDGDQTCLTV
jgi:hypothetical protein